MINPDNTTEHRVNAPVSRSIRLMDPDSFETIHKSETSFDLRLHHVAFLFSLFSRYGDQLLQSMKDYPEIFRLLEEYEKNLPESDQKLSEAAKQNLAKMLAKSDTEQIQRDLASGKLLADEYIGQDGEHSEQYEQGVSKVIVDVLSLPKKTKVLLTFESDAVCEIIKTPEGFKGHCKSEGVTQDDMTYWYALNKCAVYLNEKKDARANMIGLVTLEKDRYGIWMEAGLLRDTRFLASVFEAFLSLRGI